MNELSFPVLFSGIWIPVFDRSVWRFGTTTDGAALLQLHEALVCTKITHIGIYTSKHI